MFLEDGLGRSLTESAGLLLPRARRGHGCSRAGPGPPPPALWGDSSRSVRGQDSAPPLLGDRKALKKDLDGLD